MMAMAERWLELAQRRTLRPTRRIQTVTTENREPIAANVLPIIRELLFPLFPRGGL
jgi:hypothetical protein